ncbi:MAG: TetR/AcrR family transcriptional regulator [Myxococcota bacterium]
MPLARFAKLDEAKQTAILEAALDEFASKGFDAASFNRIVARAGVSKGAIYYYFSDKEDLYLTVLERALSAMGTIEPPEPARSVDDYWSTIERIYRDVVQVIRRDARVVRLLQSSAAELDRATQSPRTKPFIDGVERWTTQLLHQGQAVGAVRSDVDDALLVGLTFAAGEALDRYMLARGDLATDAGTERAIARGIDTLERLLAPGAAARGSRGDSDGGRFSG